MKKSSILIMILMMMAIQSALAQQGENLVQNGSFEQGNVGFKSDARFKNHSGPYLEPGYYTMGDSLYNQTLRLYRAHQNTLGNYQDDLVESTRIPGHPLYIMNDRIIPEEILINNHRSFKGAELHTKLIVQIRDLGKKRQRLWYDSITIKPNTSYSFSCYVMETVYYYLNMGGGMADPADLPMVKLCVNGKNISKILLNYKWNLLSGEFTSGPDQTRIEISINNLSITSLERHLLIDNVVFKEIQPVKKKEQITVVPPKPVKKDTVSQLVAVSADFKKDISIDQIKINQEFQLSHIYFESAKYNLLAASFPELNDLVTFMKKYPTLRIRLEGHTDNQGDPQLNVELSENRVKAVKKYLVEQGIDESRIEWIGYGEQRPTNSNADENLRQKNRRVEVVIISN